MKMNVWHKPFMDVNWYEHKCKKCKHLESNQHEVCGATVHNDVCTYPYAERCMMTSGSYQIGTILAFVVLIICLLIGVALLLGLLKLAWFLFKFIWNLTL